jgi:hypothetical protein
MFVSFALYTGQIKPVALGSTQHLHPTMLVKALASSLVPAFLEGLLGSPSQYFLKKIFEPQNGGPKFGTHPKFHTTTLLS